MRAFISKHVCFYLPAQTHVIFRIVHINQMGAFHFQKMLLLKPCDTRACDWLMRSNVIGWC